jgi:uncharacterized protein (DUF849 family)
MMSTSLDTPCMVMVAPNGGRHGRDWHARVPLTAAELAADAVACAEAGASALHFHVRDAAGRHSLDAGLYREWLGTVRAAVGERLVLQVTTEALGVYRPEQQIECVRAVRPAAVSLALRELAPAGADPGPFGELLGWLVEQRISPQFILYDPGEVTRLHALRRDGTIPQAAPFVLFVLGRYLAPGQSVAPAALLDFLARHDASCPWAVCAFGRAETACLAAAAALGGHVRVGLENNRLRADGAAAAGNAERVAAIVDILRSIGRPVATAGQARALMAAAAA